MALCAAEWQKLPVALTELCINTTLRCGQSFRWRKSAEGEWSCALHGRILSFRQDRQHLHYRSVFPSPPITFTPPPSIVPSSSALQTTTPDVDDTLALVNHYLNLAPNLSRLYREWSACDSNFQRLAPNFAGIRILRQDAWEALIGFICSSNNNIGRISGMVHNLCLQYGTFIGHLGTEQYHDFPTPTALAQDGVEAQLIKLGFGYRAKYIAKTAKMVEERGLSWLEGLCNPESPGFGLEQKPGAAGELEEGGREGYRVAHEGLLDLHGVGPKVADCVCLFGLGWGESVPVDTHVWQIAQRSYNFGKGKHKSLTTATYNAVANHFRTLWGKEAGWAHSVLFTADLKSFAGQLAKKVEVESEEIKDDIKPEEGDVAVATKVEAAEIMPKIEDGVAVAVKEEVTEIIPKMEERAKIVPKMEERAKIVPKMEERAKIVPKMEEGDVAVAAKKEGTKIIPKTEERHTAVAVKEEDTEIIPTIEESSEELVEEKAEVKGEEIKVDIKTEEGNVARAIKAEGAEIVPKTEESNEEIVEEKKTTSRKKKTKKSVKRAAAADTQVLQFKEEMVTRRSKRLRTG